MVPKISIVMPAYNAEKYLEESINSILGQTFKDFEFIIIDDASTDNSSRILQRFKRKDKRIILLKNKKNQGVARTRNIGMKIAKGRYIATFDADDISLSNRLEIQYNFLEHHPDIFLTGGSAIIIDENGTKIGIFKKFNNPKKLKKKLLKSNPIVNSSVMFRNTGNVYYRDKFDGADEYDLFLRLLSERKKLTNLEAFLVKYRITPGSISLKKRAKQEFFSKKIQQFYFQREKFGKDEYDKFDIRVVQGLKEDADFEKVKLTSKILGSFQDNHMKETRESIKIYNKRYGFNRFYFFLYLLSFFPHRLTFFLVKHS
jgi:glycosyltransferase involved in cell wall biosynthesis